MLDLIKILSLILCEGVTMYSLFHLEPLVGTIVFLGINAMFAMIYMCNEEAIN